MKTPHCSIATKKGMKVTAACAFIIPLVAICLFCFPAGPQAADIAALHLSIEATQRVLGPIEGSLPPFGKGSFGGGVEFTIVTMRGTAPKPLKVDIGARSFVASYQEKLVEISSGPARSIVSSGISLKLKPEDEDNWILDWTSDDGSHMFDNLSLQIEKPGPVLIKVAFKLPKDITAFDVFYRSKGIQTPIGSANTKGTSTRR
jgi:hypothetical protein